MPAARPSRSRTPKTIKRDATTLDFEAWYYESLGDDARRRRLEGDELARRTRAMIVESQRVIREVAASIERSAATIARSKDSQR